MNIFSQMDMVSKITLLLLISMSIMTWYLILTKCTSRWIMSIKARRFLTHFKLSATPKMLERHLEESHPQEPFSHVSYHALVAARHGWPMEDSLRRVLDEEKEQLESGLGILASIGSTAPFIGLFGTVWGVYHALAAIGASGKGTLDAVAGPVGEALIMTAIGLAVAIPAVLTYNALIRRNRYLLNRLRGHAHDMLTLITTGKHREF